MISELKFWFLNKIFPETSHCIGKEPLTLWSSKTFILFCLFGHNWFLLWSYANPKDDRIVVLISLVHVFALCTGLQLHFQSYCQSTTYYARRSNFPPNSPEPNRIKTEAQCWITLACKRIQCVQKCSNHFMHCRKRTPVTSIVCPELNDIFCIASINSNGLSENLSLKILVSIVCTRRNCTCCIRNCLMGTAWTL